jgi:hypothetical protein
MHTVLLSQSSSTGVISFYLLPSSQPSKLAYCLEIGLGLRSCYHLDPHDDRFPFFSIICIFLPFLHFRLTSIIHCLSHPSPSDLSTFLLPSGWLTETSFLLPIWNIQITYNSNSNVFLWPASHAKLPPTLSICVYTPSVKGQRIRKAQISGHFTAYVLT